MPCSKKPYAPFPVNCKHLFVNPQCEDNTCLWYSYTKNSLLTTQPLKVGVVIPVFDTPTEIFLRCVLSVKAQRYRNVDIYVIDDGSEKFSDFYSGWCKENKVFYRKLSGCHGASYARNEGVLVAKNTCPIIAFLDSDDAYHENHLLNSVYNIVTGEVDMVISSYELVYHSGDNTFRQVFSHSDDFITSFDGLISRHVPVTTSCLVMTTKRFITAGGFEEGVYFREQEILVRRVVDSGGKYVITTEPTVDIHFYVTNEIDQQSHVKKLPVKIKPLTFSDETTGQELDKYDTYEKRYNKLSSGITYKDNH